MALTLSRNYLWNEIFEICFETLCFELIGHLSHQKINSPKMLCKTMSQNPWSLTFHILETIWLDPSSPFEGYKLIHIQAFRGILIEREDTLEKFYFILSLHLFVLESMNLFCSTPKLFISWEKETQLLLLLVSLALQRIEVVKAQDWSLSPMYFCWLH